MPGVPNNPVVCFGSVGASVVQTIQVGRVTPGGKVKGNSNKASCRKVSSICYFSVSQNFCHVDASLVWQMPRLAFVDSMCINNSGLIRAELQKFFASFKQKCCLFFPCFLTSLALGVFPANLFLPELFSKNDSRAYTILWESNTVVVFCCSRVAPLKFSSYTTWYFAWHNLNTTISLPIHLWTSIYK